jgi:polysaccharide export outer membrane protein
MLRPWFRRIRFSLREVLVLILGLAIGYSLNLYTLQLLTGRPAFPMSLPPYVIEPPDVLQLHVTGSSTSAASGLSGKRLVGPDGRINLGPYGQVYVAGLTLDKAQEAIRKQLLTYIIEPQVAVDVFAYNSKTYYVITQSSAGDNVQQFPITGNETVLDALAHLSTVGSCPITSISNLFIVRTDNIGRQKTLPIDWQEIGHGGSTETDYQLVPRDRLYISQKSGN